MITEEGLTIVFAEDLIYHSEEKPFDEIDITDFKGGMPQFYRTSVTMFVDHRKGTKTKILKNRYGNRGTVINE